MNKPFEVSCLYERNQGEYRFERLVCTCVEEAERIAHIYRLYPPRGYRVHRGPTIKENGVVIYQDKPP